MSSFALPSFRKLDDPVVGGLVIEFDRVTATAVTKTAAATPLDMMGNVGGTLGLFCGISILSVVEAAYWTVKTVLGWWAHMGSRKARKRGRRGREIRRQQLQ